jgi:MFS family permease
MQTVTRADPPTVGVGRGAVALLSAATVSRFADSAATVAVVLLVIARTGDAQLAGLVVAAFALPTLVTGPVLGAYLDRARAKRLVFAANQLLLAGTLAGILVLAGRVPGAVLVGLGLLAGLTAPVLTGGYSSLVPLVVPPGRLPRANAADAASYDVAGLGAPALIAAIASGAGAGPALAAAAGIAAAGLLLVLAAPMPASSPGTGVRPAEPFAAALVDGLRLLWRVPLLRTTTVATTLSESAHGLLPVTLPLLAVQLGHPAAHGGWLLTAVSAGSLAGALASVRLLARARPELVLAGALGAFGVLLAVAALTPTLTAAVAVAAFAGIAAGPVLAATFAIRQRSVPAHRYAQAVASAASLKVGAFALGAAATGPLAAVLTARQLLLTVAAGQVLAVLTLLPRVRVCRP